MPKTILITGARGRVGSALVSYLDTLNEQYDLRLADLDAKDKREIVLDITNLAACRDAFKGVDVIIHLAGVASPEAPFEAVLPVNIGGTYNVFRAASDAGVPRVVFASSAQAIEGYPLDVQVRSDMPVRPKNLYGVSKACGEAFAAYFAYQEGLEAIAVRIGAFERANDWERMSGRDLSAWIDPEDLCELFVRCIEADLREEPFAIVHGISDNRFKRLDLTDTRARLEYEPKADSFSVWNVGLYSSSEQA